MNRIYPIIALILVLGLTTSLSIADPDWNNQAQPAEALPLSSIIMQIEQTIPGTIQEIDWENGVWEVEVYQGSIERELVIDPRTGEILSNRLDD